MRYLKESWFNSFARDSSGYLKRCCYCGKTIYMLHKNGRWLPYESWVAGNVNVGEWLLHNCGHQ